MVTQGASMALPGISNIPYLRKVFFFTHGIGLLAGVLFPAFTLPFFGDNVPVTPFFLACLTWATPPAPACTSSSASP